MNREIYISCLLYRLTVCGTITGLEHTTNTLMFPSSPGIEPRSFLQRADSQFSTSRMSVFLFHPNIAVTLSCVFWWSPCCLYHIWPQSTAKHGTEPIQPCFMIQVVLHYSMVIISPPPRNLNNARKPTFTPTHSVKTLFCSVIKFTHVNSTILHDWISYFSGVLWFPQTQGRGRHLLFSSL